MKDVATIARKWASRAGAAGSDYKDGVLTTSKDWANNTAAAQPAYEQGVGDAIAKKRFATGVTKATTAKWKDKASNLGASRYGQGVAAGESAYNTGFAPFAQVISSVPLAPRGSRGSPQNLERVRAVADALHRAKVGS